MKEQGSLGQWLKERCKREHLSLRQAAARTDLSHQTIAGIIAGNRPLPETIEKLAHGFGGNGKRGLALLDRLLVLAYRTEQPENEGYLKLIPLLSSGYQHLVEVLVMELAKIEGVEVPASGKGDQE